MASTVWKGSLTFGLVSIPIRLIKAARAERVKLRQLSRIRPLATTRQTPLLTQAAGRRSVSDTEVPTVPEITPVKRVFEPEQPSTLGGAVELVKGYEVDKNRYVVLEEEDLKAIAPQNSTEVQVVEFVNFSDIDPVYLETSYYVIPDQNAEKAYAVLLVAMRQAGYAAIGQFTMHRRDHVLILRPGKTGIIAHTMFYPDEVRSTEEFRTNTNLVAGKELDLAKSLIQALAQPFDPKRFKNEFGEKLRALIDSQADSQPVARVEPRKPAEVVDIVESLKRSLAQAKSAATEHREAKQTSARPERKPAAAEKTRLKAVPPAKRRKPS